ncbi:hypothetical protein IID20_02590 [Patescibacteria group bacterium]|nr:hypothetical protein [Patescibacteria group bacterium]
MKIYIICPVRNRTKQEEKEINAYVADLEEQGNEVREPSRDTVQEDEIGLRITEEHEEDIIWADQVHVWWNPSSEGSCWDVAQTLMAQEFMPDKKIIWVNQEPDLKEYINKYQQVVINKFLFIFWKPKDRESLWRLAQARMTKKFESEFKIYLFNPFLPQITEKKSYHNVALATFLKVTADSSLQELENKVTAYNNRQAKEWDPLIKRLNEYLDSL